MSILIFIFLSTVLSYTDAEVIDIDFIGGKAPDIITKAHRYHNILFSQEDKNRHWYFIRDQKCSLFTKDFLSYYKRGK